MRKNEYVTWGRKGWGVWIQNSEGETKKTERWGIGGLIV